MSKKLYKTINLWRDIINIFNYKNSNKIFTRNELQMYMDYTIGYSFNENTFWTYKNLLERSGFIKTIEPGVYRKLNKIPNNLTYSKAENLALRNRFSSKC